MAPRFLVTAGNTREKIDAVRDWGNIFTGNTGLAIARALAEVGAVDLLTSNRQHLAELAGHPAIHASGFTSHGDLRGALSALMARHPSIPGSHYPGTIFSREGIPIETTPISS